MIYITILAIIAFIISLAFSIKGKTEITRKIAKNMCKAALAASIFLAINTIMLFKIYSTVSKDKNNPDITAEEITAATEKLISQIGNIEIIDLKDYYVIKNYKKDAGIDEIRREHLDVEITTIDTLILIPKTPENEELVKEYICYYDKYVNEGSNDNMASVIAFLLGISPFIN